MTILVPHFSIGGIHLRYRSTDIVRYKAAPAPLLSCLAEYRGRRAYRASANSNHVPYRPYVPRITPAEPASHLRERSEKVWLGYVVHRLYDISDRLDDSALSYRSMRHSGQLGALVLIDRAISELTNIPVESGDLSGADRRIHPSLGESSDNPIEYGYPMTTDQEVSIPSQLLFSLLFSFWLQSVSITHSHFAAGGLDMIRRSPRDMHAETKATQENAGMRGAASSYLTCSIVRYSHFALCFSNNQGVIYNPPRF